MHPRGLWQALQLQESAQGTWTYAQPGQTLQVVSQHSDFSRPHRFQRSLCNIVICATRRSRSIPRFRSMRACTTKRSRIGASTRAVTRRSRRCRTWSGTSASTRGRSPTCATPATNSSPRARTWSNTSRSTTAKTTETNSNASSASNAPLLLLTI